MVDLHRIDLSREHLDRMPDEERRLFILVAHASNEINVLAKLFRFAASSVAENGVASQAETMQAQVLAKVFVGKIYEFWQLLQNSFFGAKLSLIYESKLDPESASALQEFKRYFGKENLVNIVRNKFAFHYSGDQIDAGYAATIKGDPLQIYLASHDANTLFYFAETITGRSMLEAICPGDHEAAYQSLVTETTKLVGMIGLVAAGLMVVCVQLHIGSSLYDLEAKVLKVDGVPETYPIKIPYFIEIQEANGDV